MTALSDAPRVVSRTGAVAFDRARTAAAVADLAAGPPPVEALAAELARREGAVPALRLVWPVEEDPPAGTDTEVRLPLRDGTDAAALLDAARAQAEDLLLALPRLTGIDVAGVAVDRTGPTDREGEIVLGGRPWLVVRTGGELPAALAADRSVEDRGRTAWRAVWAFPLAPDPAAGAAVLGAPTPTDERLTLPARLVADVPLDPDRRHVRAGPVTEHVLTAAAAAYPELALALEPGRRLEVVPLPGLPASAVDATLRAAVLDALRTSAWLPGAAGGVLRPDRAVAADPALDDPELAALLVDVVPDLADPVASAPAAALAALGVARLRPADLADRLAGVRREPSWWGALYAALARCASGTLREELAALPVPLVDGRTVVGPRGTLLPTPDALSPDGVPDVPGLRLVHPDAAHPLLLRLGATEADASALLRAPALREAVERSVDDAESGLDTTPLAALVLDLAARAGEPGGPDGLGALALRDADGEPRRADELVLPDGALRALVAADSPLGVLADDLAAAHPRAAFTAVGVLDGVAVLRDEAPAGPDHDLDDEEAWWAEEVEPADPDARTADPGALVAVRDLELIDDWSAAWPVLAADRAVREALTGRPGGPRPYTAWWLARHALLAGRRPDAWRLPSAAALAALYDAAPGDLDEAFLAAVGVRGDLGVASAADATDLLARVGDPDRVVDAATAARAYAVLAAAVASGAVEVADVEPPARVRTLDAASRAADPERSAPPVVLDRPWLLDVLPPGDLVGLADPAGAPALADLLDLGLASARVHGLVRSAGEPTPWRHLPPVVAWAGACGWPVPDGDVVIHHDLRVLVTDDERPDGGPSDHTPPLWVDDAGVVHTDDPVRALVLVSRTETVRHSS